MAGSIKKAKNLPKNCHTGRSIPSPNSIPMNKTLLNITHKIYIRNPTSGLEKFIL